MSNFRFVFFSMAGFALVIGLIKLGTDRGAHAILDEHPFPENSATDWSAQGGESNESPPVSASAYGSKSLADRPMPDAHYVEMERRRQLEERHYFQALDEGAISSGYGKLSSADALPPEGQE